MELIDTHAHIYLEEFDSDRSEVIERAHKVGVQQIVMPNIDKRSIERMLAVEASTMNVCHSAIGLHPCSVKVDFENELKAVEEWLGKRPFVAIGEIGTDLYWDKSFWEQQKEAFIVQLQWAKKFGLPLIIHCRESLDETIELVGQHTDENLRGVFHCFSGSLAQANRVIELGFHLGIGGVATFKNGGLDKVLPDLSVDHLVLETDSPYLAPVPYRGKRNEPGYVSLVAERIASIMGISIETIATSTTKNAKLLFGI